MVPISSSFFRLSLFVFIFFALARVVHNCLSSSSGATRPASPSNPRSARGGEKARVFGLAYTRSRVHPGVPSCGVSALDSAKRRTARLSSYLEEIAAQQAVVEQMVPVVVSTLRARCQESEYVRAAKSADDANPRIAAQDKISDATLAWLTQSRADLHRVVQPAFALVERFGTEFNPDCSAK